MPLKDKGNVSLLHYMKSRGNGAADTFANFEDDNENNGYHCENADFSGPDFDMPDDTSMDEDLPFQNEKHDGGDTKFETNEMFDHGDPYSQTSLDDLCRSHLDALLASVAENEKQTELVARVSSWKQRIEHKLEEQDSHAPFDIHEYGERILDRLSVEAENGNVMPFSNVVKCQEKHDVARTFSALLQLVNSGDVDLDRSGVLGESVCYTAAIPFHIRLLKHDDQRVETQLQMPKNRGKSPLSKEPKKGDRHKSSLEKCLSVNSASDYGSTKLSSQPNCKFSMKLGKFGLKCALLKASVDKDLNLLNLWTYI